MKVLIIYCHPSKNSFTYKVKEAFIKGLESAGHSYEISDLYADGFNPVMSENEYIREGFYNMDSPVAEDVLLEQKKINEADVIAFIYPDFWTSSPAMLEGWFQRVWTYGFAYGDKPSMKCLEKAIFLITMGGSLKDEIRRDQLEAMKTEWASLSRSGRNCNCGTSVCCSTFTSTNPFTSAVALFI